MRQAATYPKIYAVIQSVKIEKEPFSYDDRKYPVFVFVAEDGQVIEAEYPRSSGDVPGRVMQRHYATCRDKNRKPWQYLVGSTVKIFQRPQDGGRWSYRHTGQ